MKQTLIERFLRYVQVDTKSEPNVDKIPSTDKQFVLAKQIVEELERIGLSDVTLDDHCYIMATLPANTDKPLPTIGFVAHIDTSPDFTAENVHPKIWYDYDGGDLTLDEAQHIVLSPDDFPELLHLKGQTIITTDGSTLLGADDKSGVTEIVTAMEYLLQHPEIEHGTIRICFTPDEEVGRGADLFDVEKFGAQWAYTMDGSELGELEYENFNAAGVLIRIQGKNIHPGYAKGKMVNSLHIANEIARAFPSNETPETTEGYEGFYHLNSIKGNVDYTEMVYIIRDHDRAKFEARKAFFQKTIEALNVRYNDRITLILNDQYYNMREKVEPVLYTVDIAQQAMEALNIPVKIKPIRGGTDGSRLSYMGLPCPNIFAGGMNFHGRYEYVSVETMEAATMTIVKIAELVAKRAW